MNDQRSPFDKSTITGIAICLVILFGWQWYLEKKYPQAPTPATTTQTAANNESAGAKTGEIQSQGAGQTQQQEQVAPGEEGTKAVSAGTAVEKNLPTGPEETKSYEDANWKVVISSLGGRISQVVLKKYTNSQGQPIELLTPQMPGYLLTNLSGKKQDPQLSAINYKLTQESPTQFVLTGRHDGVDIQKKLTIVPEDYIINVETAISGNLSGAQNVSVEVEQPLPPVNQSEGGFLGMGRRAGEIQEYYFAHGTKKSRDYVNAKEPPNKTYEQTQFAAVGSRYFTTLIFNRGNVLPVGKAFSKGPDSILRLDYPILDNSGTVALNYSLYAGPKVLNSLKKVDNETAAVVDFGMFSVIAFPILSLMKILFGIFKNYGVAIIALTILVRLITYPFTYMSYKSMKAMQKIQPEMARIKEIHKDNQMALNQEMMKLMRENKVNPMGGCLPMVLQLPVFWALYQVLQNSIELYHSPFVGWIHDLSLKDPYYILPVLMGITMFIQQKMTPSTMDPSQAKVMLIMPIFFSFLMFSLPAGLTLYIFVSTLFGIVQQLMMMQDRRGVPQQVVLRRS